MIGSVPLWSYGSAPYSGETAISVELIDRQYDPTGSVGQIQRVLLVIPESSHSARHSAWFAHTVRPPSCHILFAEAPVTISSVGIQAQSGGTTIADEPERMSERGVFAPHHSREIIFSQTVSTPTIGLRRWKPRISLDRRTLEREDV
jgi:hypothetical protein